MTGVQTCALPIWYLDKVAISNVQRYEDDLVAHLDSNAADLLKELEQRGEMDEDMTKRMNDMLKTFTDEFLVRQKAEAAAG